LSSVDEFRDDVRALLRCLRTGGFIPHGEEPVTRDEERGFLCEWIHIQLGVEAVLDKTPDHPPQLKEIAFQIRTLPMVREILGDWPSVGYPDQLVCDRDLPVLEAKLQGMLEWLRPLKPNAPRQSRGPGISLSNEKRSGVPQKRLASAPRARKPKRTRNVSGSQRRAESVAKFIRKLTILRPQLHGDQSDYERLRRENSHFLTFKVARRNEELREKVLNVGYHTKFIRLAQEIVAADAGRTPSTIQTDWKRHKPAKFRLQKRA